VHADVALPAKLLAIPQPQSLNRVAYQSLWKWFFWICWLCLMAIVADFGRDLWLVRLEIESGCEVL
jgi:hypothetical protein